MRDSWCFPQIQLRLVLRKKYLDKIDEIKVDVKWKEVEHILGLDHCTPAVQAMDFFNFH